MFFKTESKRIAELERKIESITNILDAHGKLIRSFAETVKTYPFGVNFDGSARKKPGRPRKDKS